MYNGTYPALFQKLKSMSNRNYWFNEKYITEEAEVLGHMRLQGNPKIQVSFLITSGEAGASPLGRALWGDLF
jgi:hypothetical protein